MKRMLLAGGMSLVLLTQPVFAEEAFNVNTGAESVNETKISIKNEADVKIENDADVSNNIKAEVNTGENEVEKNGGGGDENGSLDSVSAASVKTGDAKLDVKIENVLNSNEVDVDVCCEPEEDGKGGGEENPPVAPFVPEGKGGGGELALAEGLGGGLGAESLPGAGVTSAWLAMAAAAVVTAVIRAKKLKGQM